MTKTLEASGKTIDEAIANGLKTLGMDRDDVSVEVVKQPKSGFLGIGRQNAVVNISYECKDEPAPRKEKPKAAKPQEAKREKKQDKKEAEQTKAPASPEKCAEVQKKAVAFAEGLIEKFGAKCDVKASTDAAKRDIHMEISGEDINAVIGRRGETLDAVQYLTTIVTNRGENEHWRIIIDAENYRSRREDSLENLAKKMAEKALKYKKPVALEPMPSHERKVIHSALQEMEGITTNSVGSEPNRKVVIIPEGATTKQPIRTGGRHRNGNYHRNRKPEQK